MYVEYKLCVPFGFVVSSKCGLYIRSTSCVLPSFNRTTPFKFNFAPFYITDNTYYIIIFMRDIVKYFILIDKTAIIFYTHTGTICKWPVIKLYCHDLHNKYLHVGIA